MIANLTSYVNYFRGIHQSPPIEWDNDLASFSQSYSKKLGEIGSLVHSGKYGENLYMQGSTKVDPFLATRSGIRAWYGEVSVVDWKNVKGAYDAGAGHFTCLVWKDSKRFGMGVTVVNSTIGGKWLYQSAYVVYNTDMCNVLMWIERNVLPPLNI